MPYEPSPRRTEREAQGAERFQAVLEERLVRHTVADVIGERLRAEPVPGRSWHWRDFHFNGATFDGGGFSDTAFSGATVRFSASALDAAALDMRRVRDWSHPPIFDRPIPRPLPETLLVTEEGEAALSRSAETESAADG